MVIGNALNAKFGRASCFANLIQQKSILEMSLRCTPDWQKVTLRIAEEACFARNWSYKLVATAELESPQCGRDELHAALCCAAKRRPAQAILRPFYRTNVLCVEAFGPRLLVICESYAPVDALS